TARARRYLPDAVHSFDHAPVEHTLSELLAAAFSYALASDAEPFREWFEIGVIIVLTGAVAFTATLLHALGAWPARTRWLVTAGGAGAAALYGLLVLNLRWEAEAWRAATLVAAGALALLAAPAFAGRAGATERFRRVTGRLLLRTIAVLIYALALFAGLALALGAVNTLFELDLDARIYFHTFGWIFFVLVPWVIVGGLPDYVRPGGDAGPVAAAVHRISAYLVTPLLAIYFIILYAYAVRIALTGELPKNLVSPLVIAAGLIAGVALVLFDRYEESDDTTGSFRWLRMTAPLFVPLSGLGLWALSMRWDQYGWTEFRALRVVLLTTLGALAVAAAFGVLRRRSLPTHVLPLTLAIVALLSATGPWSAMAVSRRSQQGRLAEAMGAAGIDWNATTVRDTLIENDPYLEISETTRYLLAHFGPHALPPLFAQHAEGTERYVDVVYAAGLRAARPDLAASRGAYGQLANGAALDVGGEQLYYVRVDRTPEFPRGGRAAGDTPAAADSATAHGDPDSLVVRVPVAGLTLLADLAPVSRSLLNAPPGQGRLPPDLAAVVLRDDTGRERGELFVIEVGFGGDDGLHIYQLVGLVRLIDR
ncbi:MAG TPA: DUF4153 domain-containing protein, partial [Longimicrobiales bacterium]|nr:DUF4153 domain-containing protein [Longimicrobiales bacterium]